MICPEGLREDLALMREEALRCRDILADLVSEESDPVVAQTSLRGLMEEAALEAGMHNKDIIISCRPNGLLATGEPQLLRQPELIYGIGNLIENAAEFAAKSLCRATYSAQQIVLEVADDGPGFASDILTHLGEPYTSSRNSRSNQQNDEFGLGLGFFIARTLLQRSGANVSARNLKTTELIDGVMPGGACVRIEWPRGRLESRARLAVEKKPRHPISGKDKG